MAGELCVGLFEFIQVKDRRRNQSSRAGAEEMVVRGVQDTDWGLRPEGGK